MRFTDIFIKRPVLAVVANLLILLLGYQAWQKLNIRQYPRSDSSLVTIQTVYVGASADLVRGFITTPLERVVASADGIDYIESSSAQSVSTITVHLKLNFDPNAALAQVTSKVNQVKRDLPPDAQEPTINIDSADNRFASLYLSFYSNDLQGNQITDYLVRVVQPKLSAITGVQRADILGARVFAVRIWLKSDRMAALNLSPAQVRAALAANNFLSAVGSTKGSMTAVSLTANTDLRRAEDFQNLVLRNEGDSVVRLKDIADVDLGAEDYDADVRFAGERATFMGIFVLPTANSLDVIKEVRKIIPEIKAGLPAGMKIGVPYDATAYIEDALKDIVHTLGETLLIVMVVIYLFLGSFRSVLIPVVAMPLSLIGALFFMMILGFTINLLTLLAIVLAVGLVVDDAIVVVENVERHIREGLTPYDAAIKGAHELVGPIIAMTLTLATVYAPIGFQGGLTGSLFREFAFTLAGAVVVSGIVALTLSPMMASKLLHHDANPKGFAARLDRGFDRLRNRYSRMLASTLKYRPAVYVVWLGIFILVPPFYMFSQKELAPVEDQGIIFGIVQGSPNASLDQTLLYTTAVNKVFQSQAETATTFQITQPTGGFSGMVTKPWGQRKRTTKELVRPVSAQLSKIAGVDMFATTPPPLPGGSNFPVDLVIGSTAEPAEIFEIAQQLVLKAFASGKFMFALTDLKYDRPQTEIVIDRDKAATMGLSMQQIGSDIGAAVGGNYVNRFSIQGRSYKVIPQVKRDERLNADQLKNIYVTGPQNQLISLSTIATLKTTTQPRAINRFQQLNSATISGAPLPGVSTDEALRFLEDEARKLFPEGKGYSIDYAGSARQLRVEGNKLVGTLMFSVILIFLVLAAQFESFRDPFVVLLGSVPLALAGSLLFSFLGFTSINIYSQVGLITLVGLVSKNGILIVDFANKLQEQGIAKLAAVQEAAATRLRPILMTSVATVMGHFPLVFVTGAGAAARNSIGIVLVSGMTIGTLFTLFVVPSIYMLIARDHSKNRAQEKKKITGFAATPVSPLAK